jgi:hypothetical protein
MSVFESEEEEMQWRERMLVSAIVVTFLVYTPISTAAFRLLTCRPVAPADDPSAAQLRLAMDLRVVCSDPAQWSALLAMAVPILVLVVLGVPVGFASLLRWIGPQRLADARWRGLLGFLVNGYKPQLYYWESVVLARKATVAFVATALSPAGPGVQLTTALLVLQVALVLHTSFHPFVSDVINAMDSFALVTAALSFLGGVYFVLDESGAVGASGGPATRAAASVVILLVNALFLATALALLSSRVRRRADALFARAAACLRSSNAGRRALSRGPRWPNRDWRDWRTTRSDGAKAADLELVAKSPPDASHANPLRAARVAQGLRRPEQG